jgi:hypothetical protein
MNLFIMTSKKKWLVSQTKQSRIMATGKQMTPKHKWDRNKEHLSIFKLLSFPTRNGNGLTSELPCGNKLPNGFLGMSR